MDSRQLQRAAARPLSGRRGDRERTDHAGGERSSGRSTSRPLPASEQAPLPSGFRGRFRAPGGSFRLVRRRRRGLRVRRIGGLVPVPASLSGDGRQDRVNLPAPTGPRRGVQGQPCMSGSSLRRFCGLRGRAVPRDFGAIPSSALRSGRAGPPGTPAGSRRKCRRPRQRLSRGRQDRSTRRTASP